MREKKDNQKDNRQYLRNLRKVSERENIGKGRKKDHHEIGEKLFKSFGSFLSFEPSSIQIISKLIRYHNQMSMYATNEDVYSEKIILNFNNGLLGISLLHQ